MTTTFDENSNYWCKKSKVPTILGEILLPYCTNLTEFTQNIIDLGSGGGRLARHFISAFNKVYAIDYSEQLIEDAKKQLPDINFVCGDFQDIDVWRKLDVNFHVITSNCAIRKDYTPNLTQVARICYNFLEDNGVVVFRIQAIDDLSNVLPDGQREKLFYTESDIKSAFDMFSNIQIQHEKYTQQFSTPEYVNSFLDRINITPCYFSAATGRVKINRSYYVVSMKI